jgi:hypothetical protein
MNSIVKTHPQLPASVAKLAALATMESLNELSGGVTAGFPIISYKGKVWRIRKGGDEEMHVDANGDAMPSIEVVLVQANAALSKIHYDTQYEEGANEAPRCFSNDGVRPDASVQNPISAVCANCPNNVWGSRITPQGKKSRACSDSRRMAVVFAHDLLENGKKAVPHLLRVPPASLNPLKDYAEKALAPKGIPFFGVVTRIGFDVNAAHPQFVFKPARFVNDEESDAIAELRGSPDVMRVLAEAQEFPAAAAGGEGVSSPAPAPAAAGSTTATPSQSTTAAAGNKKQAMRPATEEEAGLDAIAPAPVKAPAKPAPAPVVAEPAADAEPAPAPASKKKAAPKAAAQSAPAAEVTKAAAPAQSVEAPAAFDSLLDQILNG